MARRRTTSDSSNNSEAFCSFCGRGRNDVGQLISSPLGAFICSDCIEICTKMLGKPGDTGNAAAVRESSQKAQKKEDRRCSATP